MKILLIHADYMKFKPLKKAISQVEDIKSEETKVEECLVVFSSVEKKDEQNPETIAKKTVKEIINVANQVKAKRIVLYPFVHLSSTPSSPSAALDILKKEKELLQKEEYDVTTSPFGYYKSFEIKCKGHPLSELSREITAEGAIKVEEKYDYKRLLKEISKTKLDREKLKENDHRILGQKMDLFSFNEVAPGMVFWHNNGLIIYNELIKFWREEHKKADYKEISTPSILDKKLWQISGHWEKFRESIFLTQYEKRDFAVKPMNCPGGIIIFRSKPKSYKDLPLRVAELGVVHRQELSGVLAGLFRVIKFTQDDAHIYCTEEQLESEIMGVINLVDKFYKKFNFSYHVELSTRPQKRIGADKLWDKAEAVLEKVLKKNKIKFKINKGDGAFYGPKIDFHIKDSLDRTWQCATLQLDFAMPERFELEYMEKDGHKYRPVMLHRTVYGSLERFIGILLEHTNGNLPLWLSPIQARVISLTNKNVKFTKNVLKLLEQEGIRADANLEDERVSYKIREAEIQRVPYIIVIGDKEEKANKLAIREKGKKQIISIKTNELIEKLKKKIENRK